MSMIDLGRLRSAAVAVDPFEHCVVPGFIPDDVASEVERDFPFIDQGGSFPLAMLDYGPAFRSLVDELYGDEVREAFGRQLGIDLTESPTTITVRGRARAKDGRIHIDSSTKLVTVLIYFNRNWQAEGGRLRLLRSRNSMDDMITEILPESGMLVAFRCRENAWHGHKPFDGVRRSIQLNWVVSAAAARRSDRRHRLSGVLKRMRLAG